MSGGWRESASAWIADMQDGGDFGRKHVLDAPMLQMALHANPVTALDIGCGEGRFCRMLAGAGVTTTGIDPTADFIAEAARLHPAGDYRVGHAESLALPANSIDLVVSYLSLIDIADIVAAIAEMARVLRPGGTLLIANLNSFNTAGQSLGWNTAETGFVMDHYLAERAEWVSWRGIRVQNWHRPLSRYMALLLDAGLTLTHFSEPAPSGGDPARIARYRRAPGFS